MSVTAAVFHPEISPLNDHAPWNMYLEVGRQGWAGGPSCNTAEDGKEDKREKWEGHSHKGIGKRRQGGEAGVRVGGGERQ